MGSQFPRGQHHGPWDFQVNHPQLWMLCWIQLTTSYHKTKIAHKIRISYITHHITHLLAVVLVINIICLITIYHHISPYITIYHHISPYITIYHHISPYITIHHHISPYITIYPCLVALNPPSSQSRGKISPPPSLRSSAGLDFFRSVCPLANHPFPSAV